MDYKKLINKARKLRQDTFLAFIKKGEAHLGGSFSMIEILLSLYEVVMKKSDKFILSKAHASFPLCLLLREKGLKPELTTHLELDKKNGIHCTTGSLGHGLPIAVGTAMARKIMKKNGKIFCVIGDGEINEGSIWESILVAVNNKLDNLICVVDYNKSQIRSVEPKLTTQMFESFGCDVVEVDGHDVNSLVKVMKSNDSKKPKVILANTIKGKGIKEIENDMFAWHHRAPNGEEYKRFCEEIYES